MPLSRGAFAEACATGPRPATEVLLGLGHLPRLLYVTDERAAPPVLSALLQRGVPHNPAGVTDLLGELLLLGVKASR